MLSDVIGDKPVRSVGEADLKRFKSVLLSPPRNLSPASVNSCSRHILAALNWPWKTGTSNGSRVSRRFPPGTGCPSS